MSGEKDATGTERQPLTDTERPQRLLEGRPFVSQRMHALVYNFCLDQQLMRACSQEPNTVIDEAVCRFDQKPDLPGMVSAISQTYSGSSIDDTGSQDLGIAVGQYISQSPEGLKRSAEIAFGDFHIEKVQLEKDGLEQLPTIYDYCYRLFWSALSEVDLKQVNPSGKIPLSYKELNKAVLLWAVVSTRLYETTLSALPDDRFPALLINPEKTGDQMASTVMLTAAEAIAEKRLPDLLEKSAASNAEISRLRGQTDTTKDEGARAPEAELTQTKNLLQEALTREDALKIQAEELSQNEQTLQGSINQLPNELDTVNSQPGTVAPAGPVDLHELVQWMKFELLVPENTDLSEVELRELINDRLQGWIPVALNSGESRHITSSDLQSQSQCLKVSADGIWLALGEKKPEKMRLRYIKSTRRWELYRPGGFLGVGRQFIPYNFPSVHTEYLNRDNPQERAVRLFLRPGYVIIQEETNINKTFLPLTISSKPVFKEKTQNPARRERIDPAEGLFVGAVKDQGKVRDHNEDDMLYARTLDDGLMLAVADGMGGHNAGEVASRISVNMLPQYYGQSTQTRPDQKLRYAISNVNSDIYTRAKSAKANPEAGMGTTLTAAILKMDTNSPILRYDGYIANVGDSRAYQLLPGKHIEQLTNDHSWVEEQVRAGLLTPEQAKNHPRKNLVTRALGSRSEVEVDFFPVTLESGSLLVLCTDGLTNMVSNEEIETAIMQYPPQEAAQQLVALANNRGGRDNITVQVVMVK